jgi:hypothetical protein
MSWFATNSFGKRSKRGKDAMGFLKGSQITLADTLWHERDEREFAECLGGSKEGKEWADPY